MKIVLLSGGSGKRLWPLSNSSCSKQFIKIIDHDIDVTDTKLLTPRDEKCSMLQRVYEQLSQVGLEGEVYIAAAESHRGIVAEQLGDKVKFSAEPMRRDTFPAVLLASSFVYSQCHDDDETVAFVPVDPFVNVAYFEKICELGRIVAKTDSAIGLLGAVPTYPSAKYGYILHDAGTDSTPVSYQKVSGFVEKPEEERASELIAKGALWNCGVFCFKLSTAKQWAENHNVPFDYNELYKEENFIKLPKISFDYEVLEKAENIISLSYDGMWKDIGTWNTLTDEMSEQTVGNVVTDETTSNCNVINLLDIPVVVMGGEDLIVTATEDGILVTKKEQSVNIKNVLSKLEQG